MGNSEERQKKRVCSNRPQQEKPTVIPCTYYDIGKEKSQMTNEEYRIEISKLLGTIQDNQILKYFYIFIFFKLKCTGML